MESQIESRFDGLTERQRFIGGLLNRLQSQRFQSSLVGDALLLKIWDFEPILEDIPIWALDYCFKQAVKLHSSEFPIQANEISKIWIDMSDSTKDELYKKTGVKSLPKAECEWCNGYGKMRVFVKTVDGRSEMTPVKWTDRIQTNTMMPCYCQG